MGLVKQDDGWRLPDELWAKMEPLLPPKPPHPLGCHNPRTPDRRAMEGIVLVLRTGMQWRALNHGHLRPLVGLPALPGVVGGGGVP
jgi:transposase